MSESNNTRTIDCSQPYIHSVQGSTIYGEEIIYICMNDKMYSVCESQLTLIKNNE